MKNEKAKLKENYHDIISVENLLQAWQEFLKGKRSKKDVQDFQMRLMDNIFSLHDDLHNLTYKHGGYQAFNISDPKPRNIHKATVRDRLLHHAIYRILYPFFDKTFIADSFSCRLEKGTHKAVNRFREFAYKVSKNNTRTCWILKCDIRKFFANIDHEILIDILEQYIPDKSILWLLEEVIGSFLSKNIVIPVETGIQEKNAGFQFLDPRWSLYSRSGCGDDKLARKIGVGLPLGNLTSQLFVNIYMNKFDQFAKHKMKAKYYIRYADDFVIFSENREWLEDMILEIKNFLDKKLKLEMHPDKVFIKTLASGMDFLGWVNFSDYRVLRTATKRRMLRKIEENQVSETINSYLGMLGHGNGNKLRAEIINFSKARLF